MLTREEEEPMIMSPVNHNTILGHWMATIRIHGYKMIIVLGMVFILMQFILNFSSFHHHLRRMTDYQKKNTSFLEIARKWESQDLEMKRTMLSKDYLIREEGSSFINRTSPAMNESSQELCPLIPPKLGEFDTFDTVLLTQFSTVGRVKVLLNPPTLEEVAERIPDLLPGGRFKPTECQSRHKVAIIVPYRDREDHLRALLFNLHPILMRQQIDYGIFVIEEVRFFR